MGAVVGRAIAQLDLKRGLVVGSVKIIGARHEKLIVMIANAITQ